MNVTTTHPEYDAMRSRWELMDALYEGEHAIHEGGETYLPRLQEEADDDYQARLKMTPLFNATYRTISGMRGMIFRKPPVIEVPPTIAPYLEDIDLAGTSLTAMLQEITDDDLTTGRCGLLVDYPETAEGATQADAKVLNYRPQIVLYRTLSIYNWSTKRINNAAVLSSIRLEEDEEVISAANEFEVKCEKRYRVLDLDEDGYYRQRLFKKAGELGNIEQVGKDIYPRMKNARMTLIPFVLISADSIGPKVVAPPLIDLGTTNLHHYMQATSYERGCFFSGLPTMFISGVNAQDTTIAIGGSIANILPKPDSKAYYVEVMGEFNALRTNLEDKKREMAVLGARMLESQKAGVETSDAITRRQNGELSLLASLASTIEQGATIALRWFTEWASATGDVSIKLNKDYLPAGMTAQEAVAFMQLRDGAAISEETLFDNLKAGEIIADDTTFEEEQSRIMSTSPQFLV